MTLDIQAYQPLFTQVRIENTNHCGYKCVMCPRDKHTRAQGVMPVEDFDLVLDRIGSFKGEMHLHGFGEPLLDRTLPEKLHLVRRKLSTETKTVIISTLGVRTPEKFFYDLAEAQLNLIMVSCYGYSGEAYKKVHGRNSFHIVKENLEVLSRVRKTLGDLPEVRIVPSSEPMLITLSSKKDGRSEFAEWAESLGMKFIREQRLHNYGDGREYNSPIEQLCPVIQRRRKSVLQVTWDLNVIPCCYDYNASIVFGNLREKSLKEIFSGSEYFQFVTSHLSNNLEQYKICQNCEKDLY